MIECRGGPLDGAYVPDRGVEMRTTEGVLLTLADVTGNPVKRPPGRIGVTRYFKRLREGRLPEDDDGFVYVWEGLDA